MGERRAERDATAEPEDRHALRIGMEQQRQVREHALRQHVAAVRRVDLAVDRERDGAGQLSHRDRARRSLPIRQQLACRQCRREVRSAHGRRVLVGAARQQRSIPWRRDGDGDDGACRERKAQRSARAAMRAKQDRDRRDRDDGGHHPNGQMQPDRRDQHESRQQRAENRAERVDRVDAGRDAR